MRHIHTEENITVTVNDYYYLRNMQGDIVKLIDGTGAAAAMHIAIAGIIR